MNNIYLRNGRHDPYRHIPFV